MIKKKIGIAALCTVVIGGLAPMTAMASNPEFARSTEEWDRLQDNVLEYGEIADLIQEYNSTVQSNQYDYQKFLKDYGRTREDIAEAYRDLADDLESEMTGEEGMAMVSDFQLEQQARQLREQADNYIDDSRIQYLNYSKAEDNLTMSAQSCFISYYRNQLELSMANEDMQQLNQEVSVAELQRQAGMLTEPELLEMQESVMRQEKAVSEAEEKIENSRQTLIVLCGWKNSDTPEISEVPAVDMSEIEAIDLAADRQAAVENNYTVQINSRKLENAMNADQKESIQRTIDGNIRQVGVSLTSAWQSLQSAKRSYEQALSEETASERNLELAGQKRSAGMITEYDYEAACLDLAKKQDTVQSTHLDLLEALEVYHWNVNGMASAE